MTRIFIASGMQLSPYYRSAVLETHRLLVEEYGPSSVYLACMDHPSSSSQLPARAAFDQSALRIREADYFVLLALGDNQPFGALVEVGLALAWGKPALGVFSDIQQIPYFLRGGTETMTHMLCPRGVLATVLGQTCFGLIRAFVDFKGRPLDGLSDEEFRQQLEDRLPSLQRGRELNAKTKEFLNRR